MNDHVVTKRQDLLVQAVVQLVRETGGVLMAQQVGAGYRANQKAAATEEHRGLAGFTCVLSQVADVLGCVARRREHGELYVADDERVAIADRLMIELQVGIRTGNDAGTSQAGQLTAAAHKIVVDVCLEDVGDAHPLGPRGGHVLIDVAQRIDQCSNAARPRNH